MEKDGTVEEGIFAASRRAYAEIEGTPRGPKNSLHINNQTCLKV